MTSQKFGLVMKDASADSLLLLLIIKTPTHPPCEPEGEYGLRYINVFFKISSPQPAVVCQDYSEMSACQYIHAT